MLANLQSQLHELEKNEAKLRELVAEMETCITIEGSIMTQAGSRRERN
jgi:hypothetical protein